MKLIDADKLLNKMINAGYCDYCKRNEKGCHKDCEVRGFEHAAVIEMIKAMRSEE